MKSLYSLFPVEIIVMLCMLCSSSVIAQQPSNCPASPYPINVKQAGGSILTIIGKGSMFHSWTETIDGYSVVNKNGVYEYANKVSGKLVPTGIAAKNVKDRKSVETEFLKKQPKSLSPDRSITSENSSLLPFTSSTSGPKQVGYPSTGGVKALMLLIKYPDLPNTYTTNAFDNLMNQPNYRGTGSFKDFFITSSFGQLNITTNVFGWYTAAHPYTYYGKNNGSVRATTLVREAVDAAEAAGVDFSQYDNDHDGVVDGIIVAHAGPGAEEGSLLEYIWSHRWVMSAGGNQVTYDGVLINDYIINPESRTYTNDMVGRGIFCHEFGHNLGLPDLYDTNNGSEGLGEWSLMASASWLGNEHTPGNMCAWCRSKLNWLNPITLDAAGSYSLNPASFSNQVYRINTSLTNEYFLLENRQKTGLDNSLRGSGLAIFHVNTNSTSNADENLKMVDLEEADGLNNLDNEVNRGDAGDLFPGASNNTSFNYNTNPNTNTYNSTNTNLSISNISIDATGKALFDLRLSHLNEGPTVIITSPVNGNATFIAPATINIKVDAADKDGSIAKVEYFSETRKLGENLSAPYNFNWTNVSVGEYKLTAKASDNLGKTTTSEVVLVTVKDDPENYCVPVYTYGCSDSDFINSFSFNTLENNNTGCNNGNAPGYTNYTPSAKLTTSVNRGQSYSLKMQSGPEYGQYFGVWIDYNNDKDFTDAGEFVYASSSAATTLFTTSITIPSTATIGSTRMRVRCRYGSSITSMEACSEFPYGETEDYTINIENLTSAWNVRFGGSSTDIFAQVIKTSDDGFLLAGRSSSGLNGDKTQGSQGGTDIWVVKINSAGIQQWNKRFGGSANEVVNSVIQTIDGGFLLGGSSDSGVSGDKTQASRGGRDYWIVKISSSGTKQWDKRFGGTGYDYLNRVVQLNTGEYLLAGVSNSPVGGDKSQASLGGYDQWIIKLNSTGIKLWDKRLGGSLDEYVEGLLVTTDGGFLIGGYSASGINGSKSQTSRGGYDYWLVKMNSSGTKIWDKRFGGSLDDKLWALIQLIDGNYLLGGTSASGATGDKTQSSQGNNDFWAVKVSSSGAKMWDKRFGGTAADDLQSMVQTADGGLLFGGTSASGLSGDKTQISQGSTDYWIVKTSNTGTKQWDKRFGGNAAENLRSVLTNSDGSLLLGGTSASGSNGDKYQSSQGGSDYWIVKVSSFNGFAAPVASAEETLLAPLARVVVQPVEIKPSFILRAVPNPITDKLQVSFSLLETQPVNLQIYSSQGKAIKTLYEGEAQANKIYEVEWQPQPAQAAGLYILQFRSKTNNKQQKILYSK